MAEPFRMDRRTFLAALGAASALGLLTSCSDDGDQGSGSTTTTTGRGTGTSTSPSTIAPGDFSGRFGPLRQLQSMIRQSPDHLPTVAAAAVATKDPAVITAFVRDNVVLLPGTSFNADALTESRWGWRGALRSGSGTWRERADLLQHLLAEADIDATVVAVTRPDGLEPAAIDQAAFAPDFGGMNELWDTIADDHLQLGDDTTDDAADRADAAVDALLGALPTSAATATQTAAPLPATIPVVEFTVDGTTNWATALGDEPILTNEPAGLTTVSEAVLPQVSVAVSVAVNPATGATIDRSILHEVLRADWSAADLAGRHLVLGFGSPGNPAETMTSDLSSSPIRQPVLRLHAVDLSAEELEAGEDAGPVFVVAGTAVHTAGGLVEVDQDDPTKLIGPFGPVAAELGTADPADVAELSGSVNPASFTDIEVLLQATDADGEPIDGLSASDFTVTEDGEEQRCTLTTNGRPAETRVLVVYDTSGSVEDYWDTPTDKTDFEAVVADALVEAAGTQEFVVQVIPVGSSATDSLWKAPDAETLRTDLAASSSISSDIWMTLANGVPASGASVVILVSDNAPNDLPEDIPGFQNAFGAAGIPIVVMPVGAVDESTTDAILSTAATSVRIDPASADAGVGLAGFVGEQAASVATTNYRLRYRASEEGAETRTVIVTVGGAELELGYEVPAEADRAAPSGIAGVYVEITVGDQRMRRRLGGVRASDRGTPDAVTPEGIADARRALDGLHTISFETGASTGQLLDDVVSAVLTFEPLVGVWDSGPEAILGASAGWRRIPYQLAMMAEQVAGGVGAVPDGLRVRVLSEHAGVDGLVVRSDVVPSLNRWVGASADGAEAFRSAMRASVAASIREAQTFEQSAAGQLEGADLIFVEANATIDGIDGLTDDQRVALAPIANEYLTFHRLVAVSDDAVAMWVIDPASGTTTAIGRDGRGSGLMVGGGGEDSDDAPPPTSGGPKSVGDCLVPADVADMILAFIGYALAIISAYCMYLDPAVSTAAKIRCIGADVYGAVTTAVAAYYGNLSIPAGVFGVISYGLGLPSYGKAGARILLAVLLLMMNMILSAFC